MEKNKVNNNWPSLVIVPLCAAIFTIYGALIGWGLSALLESLGWQMQNLKFFFIILGAIGFFILTVMFFSRRR
jgi:hypothetical protein